MFVNQVIRVVGFENLVALGQLPFLVLALEGVAKFADGLMHEVTV